MDEPVRRAASAVPPTASITSAAVVKTVPDLNERIGIPPKIIHAAFIMQDEQSRLWRARADFKTMPVMAVPTESSESTAAVAARLRLTREAFGMNKAAWSRLVGITPQALSNVEGTKNTPASNRIALDQALLICKATGVSLDWIYRGHRDGLPHKVALAIQKLESQTKRKAG